MARQMEEYQSLIMRQKQFVLPRQTATAHAKVREHKQILRPFGQDPHRSSFNDTSGPSQQAYVSVDQIEAGQESRNLSLNKSVDTGKQIVRNYNNKSSLYASQAARAQSQIDTYRQTILDNHK